MSAPGVVIFYSRKLATCLSACHQIASILVDEHWCWHRELVNSQRCNLRIYHKGDIVFSHRATRYDAKRGLVDKLQYSFTGPWKVVTSLPGGSYELEHCLNSKHRNKKHASALSPYPLKLIPFQPLDGADNCYGQLNKIISDHPFKEAGLKGFNPPQPFAIPTHFAQCGDFKDFHWPTLAELNNPFSWLNDKESRIIFDSDNNHVVQDQVLYTGPPPSPAAYQTPPIPPISSLVASIIKSSDKLFFIAHSYNDPTMRKWRLSHIAFDDSTTLSPSRLQDGRFLVEFFTLHHDDIRYGTTPQISVSGCNTTTPTILPHLPLMLQPTSSDLPTRLRPMLSVTAWSRSDAG
jgi:hypothetical protein